MVSAPPALSTRSKCSSFSCSATKRGSEAASMARWKTTSRPCSLAASSNRRLLSQSNCPSACKKPNTTPSTPKDANSRSGPSNDVAPSSPARKSTRSRSITTTEALVPSADSTTPRWGVSPSRSSRSQTSSRSAPASAAVSANAEVSTQIST